MAMAWWPMVLQWEPMEVHGNAMVCHKSSWQCHGVPWRFMVILCGVPRRLLGLPWHAMPYHGNAMACCHATLRWQCHVDAMGCHGAQSPMALPRHSPGTPEKKSNTVDPRSLWYLRVLLRVLLLYISVRNLKGYPDYRSMAQMPNITTWWPLYSADRLLIVPVESPGIGDGMDTCYGRGAPCIF